MKIWNLETRQRNPRNFIFHLRLTGNTQKKGEKMW